MSCRPTLAEMDRALNLGDIDLILLSGTPRTVEQADLDLDSPFPVAAVGSTDRRAP
jgi:hypothetical protein